MKAKNLLKAAIIAGSAVAIFSCGGGGGGASNTPTTLATKAGIGFDGYLKGSVVFADCYGANENLGPDGKLSSKDPRTVTIVEPGGDPDIGGTLPDLDGNPSTKENFNLVVQCDPERIYLFGGYDVYTRQPFSSLLIGSLSFRNINPVTSIILSSSNPEGIKSHLKNVFGLTDNDFDKDYVSEEVPQDFFKFAVALGTAIQTIGETINVYDVQIMKDVYSKVAEVILNTSANDLKENLADKIAEAFTEGLEYAKANAQLLNSDLPYELTDRNAFKKTLSHIIGEVLAGLGSNQNYYGEADTLRSAMINNIRPITNDYCVQWGDNDCIQTAKIEVEHLKFMNGGKDVTNGFIDGREGDNPYGTLETTYNSNEQKLIAYLNINNGSLIKDGNYEISITASVKDKNSGRSALFTISPVKVHIQNGNITDITPIHSPATRLSVAGTDSSGNNIGSPVYIDDYNKIANIIYDNDCSSSSGKCLVFDLGKALNEIKNTGNISPSHPLYNVDLKGFFDFSINTTGNLPIPPVVGAIHVTP